MRAPAGGMLLLLATAAGCTGLTPGVQLLPVSAPEANTTPTQAVRAAAAVFRTESIPVEEADEFGGRVRSERFDPWVRWGPETTRRVGCGVTSDGSSVVVRTSSIDLEIQMEARRAPGTAGAGTAGARTNIAVWGSGTAMVEGEEVRCVLAPEYTRSLTNAIVQRATRTPARF